MNRAGKAKAAPPPFNPLDKRRGRRFYFSQLMDLAQAAADWEKLRSWEMPFGKFSGRKLYDIPAEYLCWFEQKGWPPGDLGRLLRIVLEAKREGAGHAFDALRKSSVRSPRKGA